MVGKGLLLAAYIAFLITLLFHVSIAFKYNHTCEHPSSCGNITCISYPFRLRGDPPNCGDPNYELVCENNHTVLNLYSGKYYVKAIDYNQSTIRVADVGVQDGNCSSLPLFSLAQGNFSIGDDPYWSYFTNSLTFMSCETQQNSPLYVDAAPCISENNSFMSSSPAKKRYPYVILTDEPSTMGDSCTIDLIVPTNLWKNYGNITYKDIHEDLVHGFELSWLGILCQDCSGRGYCHLINGTTIDVDCFDPLCGFGHITSFHCFITLMRHSVRSVIYITTAYPVGTAHLQIFKIFLAVRFICGPACVIIFLIYKWRRRHLSMYDSIEEFLQKHNNLMPIRYSYSEIKKITNNFKDKLGEGGYGSVYKGKLRSGYLVAVKMLGKTKATGQEFINEVATIGRIHHVNVVRFIGFCVEGSKRALIYDFMPNGSLDKYIISREGYTSLSWEKMYEICLGVARGIEYLHRGCEMQIIHFDIKPHNVLLDENFIPKVSDFGLAKLYPVDDSIVTVTAARGTIGYIAPELFYKSLGGVSYKADVYSFGMLLMEMAGMRKNLNSVTENSSQNYFPFWVHEQIVSGKEIETEGTEEEKRIAKKMVIVALWCIQMSPTNRPPMKKVVEMLDGELESLELPPKPSLMPEETLGDDVADETDQTCSSSASMESLSLITSMV